MSEPSNAFEKYEDIEIKPTSDLFIGVFLSNPNNEWISLFSFFQNRG
ncbi:MAG: hypothetical protein LBN39_02310 [Planctomycetaceae bacterium]|nr:hypothetical protein [Planctomycetaceae bacterium]